jgi:hypothetical protein
MPADAKPNATLPGVTAVLCTRVADNEGFPRVPSLVASLVRFAQPGTFSELIVGTPEKDMAPICDAFASPRAPLWERGGRWHGGRPYAQLVTNRPFPVRVVGDRQVLPSSKRALSSLTPRAERAEHGGRGANYRMQMLIKLAMARHVRTAHYLTLDSDVFAKRPFGLAEVLSPQSSSKPSRHVSRSNPARTFHTPNLHATVHTPTLYATGPAPWHACGDIDDTESVVHIIAVN